MNNADVHVYLILPSVFPYEYAYATILSRKTRTTEGPTTNAPTRTGCLYSLYCREGSFSETQRHKKSRGYADEPSEPQFVRKYACAPPTFSRRLVLHPRCRVATLARPVSFRGPLEGFMESNNLTWSGQSWRLPPWLWLGLAAMAVSTLHILLDFGIGLFPLRGRLSPAEGATLLLVSLIHVWWSVSLMAGAHGNGGGVASTAILGLGWTLLINGSSIMYCPPLCPEAAPLSDVAHVGSLVLGIAAPAAAIWALGRRRVPVGWALPAGALLLVVAAIWALASAAVAS